MSQSICKFFCTKKTYSLVDIQYRYDIVKRTDESISGTHHAISSIRSDYGVRLIEQINFFLENCRLYQIMGYKWLSKRTYFEKTVV